MEGRVSQKVAVKEGEDPKKDLGHQKTKGEKNERRRQRREMSSILLRSP